MEALDHILASYAPISLKEMDGVELMNRTDTKFMLSVPELLEILQVVREKYRVLEVKGFRKSRYETLYYDTPDLLFYRRHHSGKKNRWKIRKRSYVQSNLTFLEVKFKTNKDRTVKDRTKIPEINDSLEQSHTHFIEEETGLHLDLRPVIWNSFERITLVDAALPERITIDLGLSFRTSTDQRALGKLVIVEVKQERQNRHSPFMEELKRRMIRPDSMSKYCLGVALLVPGIKSNTFKEKILKIRKIEYGNVA